MSCAVSVWLLYVSNIFLADPYFNTRPELLEAVEVLDEALAIRQAASDTYGTAFLQHTMCVLLLHQAYDRAKV